MSTEPQSPPGSPRAVPPSLDEPVGGGPSSGDETRQERGIDPRPARESVETDEGDSGRLAHEARRALIGLLKRGAILASQKPKLYEALCRHHEAITSHLADMYLRLLIDERAGIGILLQRPDEDADPDDDDEDVALVTRRTLSLYDTLLLVVLRKIFQERQAAGEQLVRVDLALIESRLAPFLALTDSTRGDRRRLNGALKNMIDRRVLARVRGDDERYEITPVIRYVLNAQALEQLLAQYETMLDEVGNHA